MEILFVRHGETESNKKGEFGTWDDLLTRKGENQAVELAKNLRARKIDKIISSPMPRANKKTAEIIATKFSLTIEVWDNLKEINEGELAGKKREKGKVNFQSMLEHKTGESFDEMLKRAEHVLDNLNLLKDNEKTILLVAHRSIICVLFAFKKGITPEKLLEYRKQWQMENTEVKNLVLKKKCV